MRQSPSQSKLEAPKYISVADHIVWYVYLLLIIVSSFLTGDYDSDSWLTFSAVAYSFFGFYFLLLIRGVNYNLTALMAAKYLLVFFIFMLFWVVIQAQFVTSSSVSYLFSLAETSSDKPQWFMLEDIKSFNQHHVHWFVLQNFFLLVFFIVSLCVIRTRTRVKQLLYVVIAIGVFHSATGILAKFSNLLLVDKSQLDGHFHAARGWFVNRNHFAAYISLTMFGVITLLIKPQYRLSNQGSLVLRILNFVLSKRLFVLICASSSILALLLSQSRAGFFGIIFSSLLLLFVFSNLDKKLNVSLKLLSCLIVLLVVIIGAYGSDLLSRLAQESFSIGERVQQWQLTLSIISQRFLVGYGVGSYEVVFQYFRDGDTLRQVVFDQAHNQFLHVFLEQGFIGLALCLCLIVFFCYRVVYVYFHTHSTLIKSVSISGLIVFSATILQSLVDFHLQLPVIHFNLILIMACVISTASLSH